MKGWAAAVSAVALQEYAVFEKGRHSVLLRWMRFAWFVESAAELALLHHEW